MLSGDMNAPAEEKFRDPALVDHGAGRRLERLGGWLVDRPLPLPGLPRRHLPHIWSEAQARFSPDSGWTLAAPAPDPWLVRVPLGAVAGHPAAIVLEVRPAPSGQLGVFLEQVEQWQWLAAVTPPGARMLSLFAHSGAATLALARAGAEVVSVDASKQATALARRNAAASGQEEAAIRWICDDARAFVAREARRGGRYDGVVLDPPSWGHGPKGQAFSIERDLSPLLADVATLLGPDSRGPVLLTCHSPRWPERRLGDALAGAIGGRIETGPLGCTDAGGRFLPLGAFARRAPASTTNTTA